MGMDLVESLTSEMISHNKFLIKLSQCNKYKIIQSDFFLKEINYKLIEEIKIICV